MWLVKRSGVILITPSLCCRMRSFLRYWIAHAMRKKLSKSVETRWPEWDRPYLAHGLLLERAKQVVQARQKLQIAAALGATDPILQCAVARLNGTAASPMCACKTDLRELLLRTCPQH